MKRITRPRSLTPEEGKNFNAVRSQVEREFLPASRSNDYDQRVFAQIEQRPGITALDIAHNLRVFEDASVYDAHRKVSASIVRLRAQGLVEDCPRCPRCHGALSRSKRNVKLYPL